MPISILNGTGGRTTAAALALCLGTAGLGAALGAEARAAEQTGKWYIGANLPVMFIDSTNTGVSGVSGSGNTAAPYTTSAQTSYGAGFRLGGVVGYYVMPNLRIEGELFYGQARVRKIEHRNTKATLPGQSAPTPIPGTITTPVKGNAKQLGGMLNVWYDMPMDGRFSPFVGGGIGFIQVDQGALKYDANKVAQTISDAVSGPTLPAGYAPRPAARDTAFAFQLGGGVAYRVDDSISVHAGYKFQMAPGLKFDGENATGTVKTKTDLKVHLIEIGFRYHF